MERVPTNHSRLCTLHCPPSVKSNFTSSGACATLRLMIKRFLPLLLAPLLLAGCATTFTNLTPRQQARNTNNLYPVEVAFTTKQQSLRWETIQAFVNVGTEFYPMRQTLKMSNRWEGLVPVPKDKFAVQYRYKFDFKYNALGVPPQNDSALSPEYTLQILDK
jgi:hypothetical protein